MPAYTFHKTERLKSRKTLSRLFTEGKSVKQYPLRLIWVSVDQQLGEFPIQFSLSVPKRKFRKASQRNPIRRLIREAYRLNKHQLYEQLDAEEPQYAFMVIYMANEKMTFAQIEKAMQKLLKKWLRNKDFQYSTK